MKRGIHFISGLPRSGSTLLAAILRQNPNFCAGMSSPLGAMFLALQRSMSAPSETASFLDEDQKRILLGGLFTGYYHAAHQRQLVFDTNRLWCAKLPTLTHLFPAAKIICCVRPIPWIMDSIERLVRRNVFDVSGLFGFEPNNTVYTRISQVATSAGMVGYALDALKEAFFGEHADRLILVDYEALVRRPQQTMAEIYDFVGEPQFAHDFANVEYSAEEFDLRMGTPGLHSVRRKVDWQERESILPPELFMRFTDDAFWTQPGINKRNVRMILYRR
jgi:sulfotransferase